MKRRTGPEPDEQRPRGELRSAVHRCRKVMVSNPSARAALAVTPQPVIYVEVAARILRGTLL